MKINQVTLIFLCVFFGLFLVNSSALGQNNRKNLIHIQVINHENNEPIQQANIKLAGTQYGTATNSVGYCFLSLPNFPSTLNISHVSFEMKTVVISDDLKSDTIQILLKPKAMLLNEVNVSADKHKNQYYEKAAIIDFEILNNKLLILEKTKSFPDSYRLTLSDLALRNKTYFDLPASIQAESIYKDCMQECHIYSTDSAYQLAIDSNGIELRFPMELNHFKSIMNDCLFQIGDEVFFREISLEGFHYHFYSVHTINKKITDFNSSFDQRRLYAMNESIRWSRMNPWDLAKVSMYFDKYFLYSPLPQVLMHSFDTLVFFDHQQGFVELYYGNKSRIRSTPINYQNEKNWGKIILKDDVTKKYYTIVGQDLFEINLSKGQLTLKSPIGIYHKIRIINETAYVLKTMVQPMGKTYRYIEKVNL